MSIRFGEDPGARAVLAEFALEPSALLGRGGEASVYALDDSRVLRVHRAGTSEVSVRRRAALLDELEPSARRLPYAIPRVLTVANRADRIVTIEPRLPGRPLSDALGQETGARRAALVRSYLDAVDRLTELELVRPFYGDLLMDDAIRKTSFREYLRERARVSLTAAGGELQKVPHQSLADALPEPATPSFVYLDAYPGNLLVQGDTITAVLDFGGVALMGDARLNALAAAAYLPPGDAGTVAAWLAEHDLAELYGPARRWVAAFWSFACDDALLAEWCRSVLLEGAPPARLL
jgi:aminoglycoside phosphotransferase (APT) family kinase protein